MNSTRTRIRRTTAVLARLAVLVAGLACFLGLAWDTPIVAGRVGCLILGVRVWVIGLALLATAAVWLPEETVGNGPTQPTVPENDANPAFLSRELSDVRAAVDGCAVTSPGWSKSPSDQDCDAEPSHLVV